jgi:hypothetical protein
MIRTWMPTVGGILSIVIGSINLILSVLIIIGLAAFFASSYYPNYSGSGVSATLGALIFLPIFIISVVSIIGGIFALRRRLWGLALAGAICAILPLWSLIFGVIAVVFIALSKHEFDYVAPPPTLP